MNDLHEWVKQNNPEYEHFLHLPRWWWELDRIQQAKVKIASLKPLCSKYGEILWHRSALGFSPHEKHELIPLTEQPDLPKWMEIPEYFEVTDCIHGTVSRELWFTFRWQNPDTWEFVALQV